MVVQGILQTYGILEITRTPQKGLQIRDGGACKIMPGATIDIQPEVGLIDTVVHNEGMIQVLADAQHGKGELLLKDAGSIGILSMGSTAQIENYGLIRIDSTLDQQGFGILNTFSSTLNNYATLSLIRCEGIGLQIEENASFSNSSDGEFDLANMHTKGIMSASGPFENFGLITLMDGNTTNGIHTLQPFINGGTIEGYYQEGVAINASSTLINQGSISIENSAVGIQILVDSLINIGDITVTDSHTGIRVTSNTLLLRNEGNIQLQRVSSTSISAHGFFDNFGDCNITEVGSTGISFASSNYAQFWQIIYRAISI